MSDDTELRSPRGIQSIEVGGQLLLALAHQGRPLALKDLARDAGMTPAKAHPYLVSFQKIGLVAQDGSSGHYGLGPLALQLGLISLQQYDPVRLATPLIEELAHSTGMTVAIAVWGNRGPTLVRIAQAPSPVHVSMRHGTVMSLRDTASGRLFAALLPSKEVDAVWQASDGPRDADFEAELARIRSQGLAWVAGTAVPGVSAAAVPVFEGNGQITLSLTVIGPAATMDRAPGGPICTALQQAAAALSVQLGWRSGHR